MSAWSISGEDIANGQAMPGKQLCCFLVETSAHEVIGVARSHFKFQKFRLVGLQVLTKAVEENMAPNAIENEYIVANAADRVFVLITVGGEFAVFYQAQRGFAYDHEREVAGRHGTDSRPRPSEMQGAIDRVATCLHGQELR